MSRPLLTDRVTCRPAATPADWIRVLAIRHAVFVVEQRVPAGEELDEHDPSAHHVLALLDGAAVATGRLVVEGADGRIGRMAVLARARGQGVGSAVLAALLAHARQRGLGRARLAAQLHARSFYARFGFVAGGEHFLDAGIPHQWMERAL